VYGDNPLIPVSADRRLSAGRALRDLIEAELDHLEKMAAGAQPISPRHLGWVDLPSDSGVTEAQGSFIDYWSPQRVLADCQAKRSLLARILHREGSENIPDGHDDQLDGLLRALVTGQAH
jgi:hypothetical protein